MVMKRIKYIALVLILIFGLIGGAYAYWTDQVVIGGTAATGGLDVRITQVGVSNWNNNNLVPGGTGTSSIAEDGKSASFAVTGLYPQKHPTDFNIYQNVQIYIKNESSIPVKLSSVDFTKTSGSNTLWNNMYGIVHVRIYDADGVQVGDTKTSGAPQPFNSMDAFMAAWNNLPPDTVLEPGWTARFGTDEPSEDSGSFIFWLEPGAGNNTQNKTVSFDIKFNWVQWNAP